MAGAAAQTVSIGRFRHSLPRRPGPSRSWILDDFCHATADDRIVQRQDGKKAPAPLIPAPLPSRPVPPRPAVPAAQIDRRGAPPPCQATTGRPEASNFRDGVKQSPFRRRFLPRRRSGELLHTVPVHRRRWIVTMAMPS